MMLHIRFLARICNAASFTSLRQTLFWKLWNYAFKPS